jgi:hypothetical protein
MEEDRTIPEGITKVDISELIQEWETSRTNRESYTNDFPSLDNLVDGVPLNHNSKAPYVGDTTIAGLVRQIPRNSLQQLPLFSVVLNGTKNSVRAQLGSFFLRKFVFNEDTFGKGLLSTLQMGTEKAITHGYSTFMTVTGQMMDDFGTNMRLMHYSDVDPEPGIQDFSESGYFYVVANLTKSRVRKIRNAAAKNPNSSWYVDALDQLLQIQPETKNYSIYQSDPQKKAQAEYIANTYQFVTKYEVGRGGYFCTFCPQLPDTALRCIPNKSKFGYPRVLGLVIDPAPLTPFGLSRVRLASPNQNLANIYYQNIASMLLLNSKPPVLKRGRFTKPVQLKQGAVWEALDQNAKAELISMDNGALAQFKPMMEFLSSQIQNIMGAPYSAVNNGSNFSKTGPGVKQQTQVQDVITNQITNILENFIRQYALVALDTLIAEQTIEENIDPETGEKIPNESTIVVDDECKNAINRIAPDTIGDNNEITVDWNDYYEAVKTWTVEIELSIGKQEMEEKLRGELQDTLVTLLQNDDGSDPELRARAKEIMDMILEKTVPNAKRLSPTPQTSMPLIPTGGQPGENAPVPSNVGA